MTASDAAMKNCHRKAGKLRCLGWTNCTYLSGVDLEPNLVTLDANAYSAEEEKHCSKHKQSTKYRRCHDCRVHDEASPQLHDTSKISIWISKDFRAIADGSYNHASSGAAVAFPEIRTSAGA